MSVTALPADSVFSACPPSSSTASHPRPPHSVAQNWLSFVPQRSTGHLLCAGLCTGRKQTFRYGVLQWLLFSLVLSLVSMPSLRECHLPLLCGFGKSGYQSSSSLSVLPAPVPVTPACQPRFFGVDFGWGQGSCFSLDHGL